VQSGVRSSFQTDLTPVLTSAASPSPPAPSGLPAWVWPVGGTAAILLVVALVLAIRKKGAPPAPVNGTGRERPSILADESACESLGTMPSGASWVGRHGRRLLGGGWTNRTGGGPESPPVEILPDEAFTNRFLREGKIGQSLSHEGIIRILEAGQAMAASSCHGVRGSATT